MGTVEELIKRCRSADSVAAASLWKQYFPRLCAVARRMLPPRARVCQDEEDVAAVALHRLLSGLADGDLQWVTNHDEIWALLIVIVRNNASNARRAAVRRHETTIAARSEQLGDRQIDIASPDPGPAESASLREETSGLLDSLDSEQRQVVSLMLRGASAKEIASELGIPVRTAYRKLKRVREKLSCK